MSLASRSTRGALFLSASTLINIAVGFFGGIVLARLLPPNDFGTFALAATIFAFADVRVKLQLEQKFLRDQDERAIHLDTFFTVSVGLALISFVAVLIGAAIIVALARIDLALCLVALGTFGLLDPLTTAIRLSIEKNVAFRAVSAIQTSAALAQFGATLLGALLGFGLWSLLLGTAISACVNLGLFLRVAPRRPRLRFDHALAREFIAYGVRYGFVYAVSAIILTQFDNFIIGLLSGTYTLGFYDRAYRTSSWPTVLISASLGRIALPTYAKLHDDPAALAKAFAMVVWMLVAFTTPLALIVLLTAPDLVALLYGDQWLPSIPILQMLAVFAVFRPLWDNMVSVLVATKRAGQMARLVFIQAVALIGLATPLTWVWGAVGTAFSVGVAFVISAGFLVYFGRAQLGVSVIENTLMPLFNNLVAFAIVIGVRALYSFDTFAPVARIAACATLFGAAYLAVSALTSRRVIVTRARYIVQLVRG